ncbi:hypothetical protein [Castellaniella sp. MT123]|uniref:hypothetical protein n=1 Tax=Castellaniella sp. MT123 TaxID=3140381 RepID=UPI0031F45DFE
MPLHLLRAFIGISLLSALIPLSVRAGGTAVVQAGGQTSKLAWQTQGAVRVGQQNANDYMLVRDGKAYSVSYRGQTPVVMEIGGLLRGLGAIAQTRPNQYLPDRVDSIQDTGKTETVAGIRGRVYRLNVTDTQGKTHPTDAVLTNDPLVVNMTETYLNTMQTLFGSSMAEKLTGSLPANRRGILRLGKDFALKSISGQEPPAGQFALPAQPTNPQNLLQGLQGLLRH